jgi:hypothetical protein
LGDLDVDGQREIKTSASRYEKKRWAPNTAMNLLVPQNAVARLGKDGLCSSCRSHVYRVTASANAVTVRTQHMISVAQQTGDPNARHDTIRPCQCQI